MEDSQKPAAVGDEIFTTCGKCKSEMYHVITTVKDDVIKKVMCKGCNGTHVYKKPKAVKEKKEKKVAKPRAPRRSRKYDWTILSAEVDQADLVEYKLSDDFSETKAISHKSFGLGIITKVISDTQIEVVFEEAKKILVHNYMAQ